MTETFGSDLSSRRCVWVNGPIIIGSGPSGLATAACLKEQSVPFVILERADCIASLWQRRTYDRLKLHLPKQFCQLPRLPFPEDYPKYPTRKQFIDYLESYAKHFNIHPCFNQAVMSARFDETSGLWRVTAVEVGGDRTAEVEYIGQWLVAATGENAEKIVPDFPGLAEFGGSISHVCEYKSGREYAGKHVLVVGCGNSGMEVSLDLCHHNAFPFLVVRNSVHVLPRDVYGKSTFELAVFLMKWLPLWLADRIMLILSWLVLGDIEKYGLRRPCAGPLELKNTTGRTPGKVELVDNRIIEIDSAILATGYRSNVPSWLQGSDFFSKDGTPKQPFPNSWKGKSGLYAVGFTKKGLSGAFVDAVRIAKDIGKLWKEETRKQKKRLGACHRRCISQF